MFPKRGSFIPKIATPITLTFPIKKIMVASTNQTSKLSLIV